MLICDLHERSIVNVRYTEATNENEALDDLKTGDKDLRLLLYMFREQVLGTKCSILNVVAAPNIKEQCKNELIMNREDLRPEVVRSKLRDLLKKVKMEELKEEEDRCKTAMTTFISLIFGFLAIRNITSTILFASPSEKLYSIWLTSEQVKAIFCENFWKVVIGGYGSGKSMIARYLLQHLAKYASMPTDIYNVLLDSHSLFTEDMYVFCRGVRDAIDHNVPVNIYYGNGEEVSRKLMPYLPDSKSFLCTLANILKALIIKYGMGKYQERRFHLIVDEVDGESLDKTQADSLREIFSSYGEQLKQSHVMFLMRSMEKRRIYISGMKKTDYQSYHFYKQCGMKVLHLAKCMRNPKKVFDFIQSVVSMVEGCSNVIFQPETADQILQEDDAVSTLHHSLPDVRPQDDDDDNDNDDDDTSVSQCCAAGLQDDADELAALLPTKENALEDHLQESKESGNASISLVSVTAVTEKNMSDDDFPSEDYDIHLPNPNDIDAKAVACNRRYNRSKQKIQTFFSYDQCNTVQHYIEGKPPKMIFLNSCEDEITMEAVRKLAVALDTLCFKDGDEKKTLIICHNTFELDLYANALDVLNVCYMVYYPELNIQRSFERRKIGELLLISDHNGSRGLEYEQVIVILNPNDTFKWQYLVESMSRCTDQLILIVPYAYTERMVQSLQIEEENEENSPLCCWRFLRWITCNQDFNESLYWNEPFEELSPSEDNTMHNIISKLKRTKPTQLCTFTISMRMLPGERFLQTSEDGNTTRLTVNLADNKIKKYTIDPAIQFRSWNSTQTADSCVGRPRCVSGFMCHYTSLNGERQLLLRWDKVDTPVVIRRRKFINQPSRNPWEEIYRGVGAGFFVSDIEWDCGYNFKINAIGAVGSLESEDSLIMFPPSSHYLRGERPEHIRSREDAIKINEHIQELNNTLQRVHVRGAKEISAGQQKVDRNIAALQKCRTSLLKFHGTEALIKSIDKSITNERMFLTSKLNTAAADQRLRLHRSRRR